MTQLTTAENKLPANPMGLGAGLTDVIFDDFKQSYLTLLHPNSKALQTNDNLKAGQIINSETLEIIGGKGKPIDLYFCNFGRYWYESALSKPNEMPMKYPMTAQNATLPRLDGDIKRVPGYEFYCFSRQTVDAFPMILSFRGASSSAGKTVISYLVKNKLNLYDFGFSVDSASKVSKGGQNYWYLTVKPSTKTTDAERLNGAEWLGRTNAMKNSTAIAAEAQDASEAVPF